MKKRGQIIHRSSKYLFDHLVRSFLGNMSPMKSACLSLRVPLIWSVMLSCKSLLMVVESPWTSLPHYVCWKALQRYSFPHGSPSRSSCHRCNRRPYCARPQDLSPMLNCPALRVAAKSFIVRRAYFLPLLHDCCANPIPTPQQEIELDSYQFLPIRS